MPETQYELPGTDDFVLTGDADELAWMQCRICLQTWQITTLADGIHQWNEHICKEKK